MRRLNVFIVLVAAFIIPVSGLLDAAPAMAYNVSAVYRDCETNGTLTGHYSRAELQAAINGMPSNMAEYSDCQVIIQHALLAASGTSVRHGKINGVAASGGRGGGSGGSGTSSGPGGSGGGTSSSGGTSSTLSGGGGSGNAVNLGSSDIRPGSSGSSAAARSLPTVLLVVLILLALTAVSGGAVAIRRRVVARHGT